LESTTRKMSKIVNIGGYLVAGGAFFGFSLGAYLLYDRALFSSLNRISQLEAMGYFLGVFIPSFAVLVTVGYMFATTSSLKEVTLSKSGLLSVFSLLSMVLSALSVFYFVSFVGSFLASMALVKIHMKPTFKILSRREASFLVEMGAIFVASFSVLFLLMWLISNFFTTYGLGFTLDYSPLALLLVTFLSLLMFFTIPLLDSRTTNAGLCGVCGLVMAVLSYLFILQNEYVFFNAAAYIGVLMLFVGSLSVLIGNLVYIAVFFFERQDRAWRKLLFSELAEGDVGRGFLLLQRGRYCHYCGKLRSDAFQSWCSHCGRSLMWSPHAPFCSSCGRLVPSNVRKCPHCQEDFGNKRVYFDLREAQERKVAGKLAAGSMKGKSWTVNELVKILQVCKRLSQSLTCFIGVKAKSLHRRFLRGANRKREEYGKTKRTSA